mmetsp:Transcript_5393/g.4573  ORF Transcript_5393/g.4573 Transcript_5393/m.4573 type:complete len:171 (+) Transcript_5393:64-576(+)
MIYYKSSTKAVPKSLRSSNKSSVSTLASSNKLSASLTKRSEINKLKYLNQLSPQAGFVKNRLSASAKKGISKYRKICISKLTQPTQSWENKIKGRGKKDLNKTSNITTTKNIILRNKKIYLIEKNNENQKLNRTLKKGESNFSSTRESFSHTFDENLQKYINPKERKSTI